MFVIPSEQQLFLAHVLNFVTSQPELTFAKLGCYYYLDAFYCTIFLCQDELHVPLPSDYCHWLDMTRKAFPFHCNV